MWPVLERTTVANMKDTYENSFRVKLNCNGVPPLHDNLHKVIIKYEYCVRTNTIFSQYYPNR